MSHSISNAISDIGKIAAAPFTVPTQGIINAVAPNSGFNRAIGGVSPLTGNQATGFDALIGAAGGGALAFPGLFGGGMAGAASGAGGAGGDLFGGYSAADMGIGDTSGLGSSGGLFGGFSNADMGIADTVGGAGAGAAGGLPSWLGPAASAGSRLLGGGAGGAMQGGGGGGNPIMNFLTGQGGGPSLPGLAPGVAALQYARQQTPVDTSQLQSVFNQAGANAPLFVQAAQDPLKQAQAGGYGDILNSQAQRGIRGSSFGDQSIANYMTDTNRGIADAGTNAAQAALGLQGQLGGQISNLNALSQQMKNNLYGRAFSSLGQGLNPTPGMGGMGGAAGGGGGFPGMGGAAAGAGGLLGNLNLGGAGSAIGNAFGNGLSSIGSGLGNLFGQGNSFWSGPVPFNPLVNGGTDSINLAGDFGLAGF
jgi:hypothetical protein